MWSRSGNDNAVAHFRRPTPYLIPVGVIFSAMIIFLPQACSYLRAAGSIVVMRHIV
jgi:hypothetical protein